MFNEKVKSAKVTYETNLIESFSPSLTQLLTVTWGILQTTRDYLPVLNDPYASDDHDNANLFKMYFSSIFTNDSNVPLELPDYIQSTNYIENINISEEEVFEALTGQDPNKAMGIDSINPKVLKYCAIHL